jgi:cytochrome c553
MKLKRGICGIDAADAELPAIPSPSNRPLADSTVFARGKAAAARLGCGACHDMPGVDWPKGRVGPPLAGFRKSRA